MQVVALVAQARRGDETDLEMRGDGLFAPASASLLPERQALMERVGEALVRVGGQVVVSGFTDDVPIRTLRFPSNWHLSDERARAVAELLVSRGLPAECVRSEGRAESDPVAPNDSPANRALNRRVEITLLTARTDLAPR